MNRYSKRFYSFRSHFPSFSISQPESKTGQLLTAGPIHFHLNIPRRDFSGTNELLAKRAEVRGSREKSSKGHDTQKGSKGIKARESAKKSTHTSSAKDNRTSNPIATQTQQPSELFKGIKVMPTVAKEAENLGEELAGKLDKSKLLAFSFFWLTLFNTLSVMFLCLIL